MPRLLTEMMGSYLDDLENQTAHHFDMPMLNKFPGRTQLPVRPKSTTWSVDKNEHTLTRSYDFKNHERMSDFLRELLDYEGQTAHYGKILIDYPTVTIHVKTKDVNDVTELDKEYAKSCDQIYDDVKHYKELSTFDELDF